MRAVDRGLQRRSEPDLFLSHSSKDKDLALRLATDLNFCGVDAWLDEWEIQIGQSLTDVLAKAMKQARFVAILVSENYNKSIWTKREYKRALSREEQEDRIVMLPLMLSGSELPDFLEDRKYVDLRNEYYSGLVRVAGIVHNLSEFRISWALREYPPRNMRDIWNLLDSIGFEPFVVFGRDDFEEVLRHGGKSIREDYAHFYPDELLGNARVSDHIKSLLLELFPPSQDMHIIAGARRAKTIRRTLLRRVISR
jgi:hypothetical protein